MSNFEIVLMLVTINLLIGTLTMIAGVILKMIELTWFNLFFALIGGISVLYCLLINLLADVTTTKKNGKIRWYHRDLTK